MAGSKKGKPNEVRRTNDEIRRIMLEYFYNRNANATSARGKKGYAVKITDIRKELKASHDLSQQEVIGNLNYLISQGWIEEEQVEKSVPLRSGTIIPQSTSYYKITAAGIDKIEGPGEFTMDKFKGIRIEATGRNIITVGDGNQVNAQYQDAAKALVELRKSLLESTDVTEGGKLDAIADIDTIESQLAKESPNKVVVGGAWESLKRLEVLAGLGEKLAKVGALLAPFITG